MKILRVIKHFKIVQEGAAKVKVISNNVIILIFSCLLVLYGCDDIRDKKIEKKWQEEILLSDGSIIWVKRTASYTQRAKDRFTGSGGGLINVRLTITIPDNSMTIQLPVWQTETDELPMLLDYDKEKETWFLVVNTIYCGAWQNKWGRPKYPYAQYIVRDNQWQLVPLNEKLIGREANMFTSITNELTARLSKITKEDIRKYLDSYRSDSPYKAILNVESSCRN